MRRPCGRHRRLRSTRKEDLGRKREIYASLGVREYWLFDPTGDYLAPRLQGSRLREGEYQPLPSVAMVDDGLLVHSKALGLDVRIEAREELRFHDPATGQDLLSYEESQLARGEAEARISDERAAHQATRALLEEEAAARRTAQARIAELEARLGRRRRIFAGVPEALSRRRALHAAGVHPAGGAGSATNCPGEQLRFRNRADRGPLRGRR